MGDYMVHLEIDLKHLGKLLAAKLQIPEDQAIKALQEILESANN